MSNLFTSNTYVTNTFFPISNPAVDPVYADNIGRPRVVIGSPSVQWNDFNNDTANSTSYSEAYNGGSIVRNTPQVDATMSTGGTTSGNYAYRQKRRWAQIVPGFSGAWFSSINFRGAQTNVRKRIGMFYRDGSNNPVGVWFELNGSTFTINNGYYNSVGTYTLNQISQSGFNGDHLDGTGPSGGNIANELSNYIPIYIDWGVLKIGSVRFMLGGSNFITIAHTLSLVGTPNFWLNYAGLPPRYEVENVGTTSSAGLMNIDGSGISYDTALSPPQNLATFTTGLTTFSPNTAWMPIIGVSLRSGLPHCSNQIDIYDFDVVDMSTTKNTGNQGTEFMFVINPTLTGGSNTTTNIGKTSQGILYSGGSYTANTGTVLHGGMLALTAGQTSGGVITNNSTYGTAIDNVTPDVVVLMVRAVTGTPLISAAINLIEYI